MRISPHAWVRRAVFAAAAVALLPCAAGACMVAMIQDSIAKTAAPVALQAHAVWVPLNIEGRDTVLTRDALDARARSGRVTLVLDGLTAEDQPGSPFAVYLALAPNADPEKNDPHYVGRFTFFNEINAGPLKATPSSRTYDVTAVLQRLRDAGALAGPIGVTIVPERQTQGEVRATIGRIELRAS
jgi:hypothetical protein